MGSYPIELIQQENADKLYHQGKTTEQEEKALFCFQQAAEKGHIGAQIALGKLYLESENTDVSFDDLVLWLTEAAKDGNVDAQFKLGKIFHKEKDNYYYPDSDDDLFGNNYFLYEKKSKHWFQQAAKQLHKGAVKELIDITNIDFKNGYICNSDRDVAFFIGTLYEQGKGVEQDIGKAITYYNLATEEDSDYFEPNISAYYRLGEIYRQGINIKKDTEKASYYLSLAAKAGHKTAYTELTCLAEQNDLHAQLELGHIFTDQEKAVYWYQKSAAQGNPEAFGDLESLAYQGNANAQYALADLFEHGKGIEIGLEDSLHWYSKATQLNHQLSKTRLITLAENGYTDAQYKLGQLFELGNGVQQDSEESIYWYRRASAWSHLAKLYEQGNIVQQDYVKSVRCYKKAAKQGDTDAYYSLGNIYEMNWEGGNTLKAAIYYKNAVNLGDSFAMKRLLSLAEKGCMIAQFYSAEINDDCNWYKKSAEQGFQLAKTKLIELAEDDDSSAQYILGRFYEFGSVVQQDSAEAARLYQRSAELGNNEAQFYLGTLYENGKLVEQSIDEAINWYQTALKQNNLLAKKNLINIAEQGYSDAFYYLGLHSHKPKNAIDWYAKGAKSGHLMSLENLISLASSDDLYAVNAKRHLLLMYRQGLGVEQSIEKSEYWRSKI
jgi:TPR repeat protein